MRRFQRLGLIVLILILGVFSASAQDSVTLPKAHKLQNVRFEYQAWNNCGPATLTNALSYFGYATDQTRAASWLKPDREDKNVSPWQMASFVNTQVPELPVYALVRSGGTIETVKTLLANNIPVIIEEGYEPDGYDWMGHYLLLIGYDDGAGVFITHDSFLGGNLNYSYEKIKKYWQHFNYTYIALYTVDRLDAVNTLLGEDADERQNTINAFELARSEAVANPTDNWAWFNMGTNLVNVGMYEDAAVAFDEAFKLGMPWRTLWYQFGPFEAYYQTGRYDDMIGLAQRSLNDGGGHFVEETYYYGGLAREAKGDIDRALNNYNTAIQFNPQFTPAVTARDRIYAASGG